MLRPDPKKPAPCQNRLRERSICPTGQCGFRIGTYQIARLNPQRLSLVSGATEFLIETSLGRSVPFVITKPVVAAHMRNDILATPMVIFGLA